MAINLPFVVAGLGIRLLISDRSNTPGRQPEGHGGAIQRGVILSGYVFPLESMPPVLCGRTGGRTLRSCPGLPSPVLTVAALQFRQRA